jgi:hypothetical protein
MRKLASFVMATMLALSVVAPVAASATQTTTLNFSGSATVQSFGPVGVICDACAPDSLFGGDNVGLGARLTLSAVAQWNPSATVGYQYSPSLLRQGQTLDLVDTLTGGSGPLTVTYHATGDYGIYWNTSFPADSSIYNGDVSTYDLTTSGTGTCTLKLNGDGTYDCQTVDTLTIFKGDLFGLVGASITVPVTTTINITPDGVATVRTITAGGNTIKGPDPLLFNGPSPSVVSDNFAVACTAPAGTDALYDLASTQTNPSLVASTNVSVDIEITIIISLGGSVSLGTFGPGSPVTMNLTAPSNQVDLGPILANNVPPNTVAGGPYSGNEGAPIQFDGSGTTSICPVGLNYVWNFSDGGVAYGVQPYHTFEGPGAYSGQLTVTDATGNSASADFSVNVYNLAPAVTAGPSTTTAWGVPVALNGAATDPGSNDQSTLTYSWVFGDGSPSATGGPSVTHVYSMPGVYTATMTACDQWNSCASSSTTVNVRARNVSIGYLGDNSGTYATSSNFSASLVDEFGQPVPGRSIAFGVGIQSIGSASTSSSGIASMSGVIWLGAGSYTASAYFAGDSMYNASSLGTAAFNVSQKATSVTYTGALTGGPNKVVTVSAKLVDATNTPLAGKTVLFMIGTQSVSAVTDINGIATSSIKLNQKNGTYVVSATYTPTGGDVDLYLGNSWQGTFKLQAK